MCVKNSFFYFNKFDIFKLRWMLWNLVKRNSYFKIYYSLNPKTLKFTISQLNRLEINYKRNTVRENYAIQPLTIYQAMKGVSLRFEIQERLAI